MAERYLDGQVSRADVGLPALEGLRTQAAQTLDGVRKALDDLSPTDIVDAIWSMVREANRFAETQAPWNLAKDPARRPELEATIYGLLETMRHLAVLLHPIMPGKAAEIWGQIGAPGRLDDVRFDDLQPWGGYSPDSKVQPAGPVFPRIELDVLEMGGGDPDEEREEQDMAEDGGDVIPFSTFQQLDLRVGRVETAEPVEGADRLLRLQVNMGDGTRQLVAGIARQYAPDALVGKQVVVVANLEPATIRGVVSEGMLLAASGEGCLALVTPDSDVPEGTAVH
jgi:methionyl-tRNA synthetase